MPDVKHVPCKRKIEDDLKESVIVDKKKTDKKKTEEKKTEEKKTDKKKTGYKSSAHKATKKEEGNDKEEAEDKEDAKQHVNEVVNGTDPSEPSTPDDCIVNNSNNESPCKNTKHNANKDATN